ncbi:AAC(3) family N-acetyltransferase [Micromonospora sp. NPDC126480]|uniref:aminoglycoside N(3)-acetyltransferase n=1 Tax=Micromonospora sp. NPDC126480 TaxID=3155312 RepID=UPI003331918E
MTAGRAVLAADLRALGLPAGATVLVHASLRRVGPVDGGPATVLAALCEVLGPGGTVVVPTHTAGNSITSPAFRAATAGMTAREAAEVADRIPPFDPDTSPAEGMGAFAEHVRRTSGAVRSRHPHTSFAALGPAAADLTAVHDLDCHLGERSPLGALYAAGAFELLLGVDYTSCTGFHLAEYRLARPGPTRPHRCYVRDDTGRRTRLDFLALHLDDSDFPRLGAAADGEPWARRGRVGAGTGRLLPVRAAVDFAVDWMTVHRDRSRGSVHVCRCRYCDLAAVSPSDGSGG